MRNIKDVLRLKYVGDLSYERIAIALGVSKGAVTKYAGLATAAALSMSINNRSTSLSGRFSGVTR